MNMEWREIKSAPKDGTELSGWRDDCGYLLIRWTCACEFMTDREIEDSGLDEDALFQEDWFCADFIAGSRLEGPEAPTLWQPLPPTPIGE